MGDKEVPIFLKDICPKVNVMARVEFELVYYDVTVYYVCCYATRILSMTLKML